MNIGSINYGLGASYGAYHQKLTQETKAKLELYGISYNSNITEQEAKQLIIRFEKNKNSGFQNSNSNSLFDRAKQLAKKLGIQFDEQMTFEKLLALIETTLEQRIQASSNNAEELNKLRDLSQELASIQAQSKGSSGYDNSNQALLATLELLGEYNKNFFKN